jgi:hypothetical protein
MYLNVKMEKYRDYVRIVLVYQSDSDPGAHMTVALQNTTLVI